MKARRDHVVVFHYELSDESGSHLESSRGAAAVAVLVGHRNVIRGVDSALVGREAGERFKITVPPEQGYGRRRKGWTERVSKKYVAGSRKPKAGDIVWLETRDGRREVTVLKVGGSVVDIDLNHPMAGKTLSFDIEVLEVREAMPVELDHGHVHNRDTDDH